MGFADSLIRAGLPLMKNEPTLLAKNVLLLLLVIINKCNYSKKKIIDKAWLRWESKIEKWDISWNYLHILKKHIYWWKSHRKKMKVKQRDKRWITELIISCISCQCNMKYISSQSTYPSKWNKNKSRSRFLIQPHSLSNFEIQRYYQNKATFTYVYSRNNLPKIKERVYIIIQE